MTRPTRRGAALVAVAVVTYIAARVLGTWELYLVALALAGMTAVAWILVTAASRGLEVERRVTPEQPAAGEPLAFEFAVRTPWRLPGLHVVLADAVAGAHDLPGTVVVEDMGLRQGLRAVAGPRPARRGVYRLPAPTATIEDPMGLVRRRMTAGEPLRLTVVPRLEELTSCGACSQNGARPGGGRRRSPTRSAWEFRGIRPHVRGEPVDRVDWKSTARTGSLMLREMEADTEDDLTVVLHAPPPPAGAARRSPAAPPHDAFETAVVAAGSMAAFTLRSGHAVSLALPGSGRRELRLTSDAASRRRLLAVLAEARPDGGDLPGSPFADALGDHGRRRRMLTLVTTHLESGLVASLGRLRRRGETVAVVHVVPGGPPAGEDPGPALAAAGIRYYPIASAAELRDALASGSGDRLARAR